MGKQFRSCDLNQAYLLPPSLQDWLPEGHVARFVAEVVEALDLSAIYAKDEERDGRGLAAYDPRMMVRVLIYSYSRGGGEFAADRGGDLRGRGAPLLGGRPASGSRHDRDVSAGALGGSGAVLRAGLAVVPAGGAGKAGTRGAGRDEDQGQRLEAQGDELGAEGGGGEEVRSGSGGANPGAREAGT